MKTSRNLFGWLITLSAIAAFTASSHGQTNRTWNGGSNTTWSTAGNWTGGVPDTNTEVALFDVATANDPASFATAIAIGGFSLTGGEARNLIFTNTISLDQYGVDNSSAFDLSITGAGTTTLSAAQTWSVTGIGNTTFGKAIAIGNNNLTLDGSNTGTGTINSVISGNGDLVKSGSGTWALSQANTYGGTTTVSGGVLLLNNATAIPGGIGNGGGTASLILNGGVVGLGSNDFNRRVGTQNNRVQWTGSGGFAAYGADRIVNFQANLSQVTWNSGSFVPTGSNLILGAAGADATVDFQNPIAFAGAARTVQVDNGSAAVDGILSGTLTGTGSSGLTKTGAGALAVTNANTYAGLTTISAGTLFANNTTGSATGTGAVSVGASGKLGGTGTITPSGSNGINVTGVLAPGGSVGTGNLTLNLGGTTGTVTMNSGASFEFQLGLPGGSIASTGVSDLLTLASATANDFAFSGNNVNFLNSGALGFYKLFDTSTDNANTWTGLTFNSTTGVVSSGLTYNNLASGLSGAFIVGTSGNGGTTGDIYFQVIPEPGAVLLGGLGTLLLLRRRRAA